MACQNERTDRIGRKGIEQMMNFRQKEIIQRLFNAVKEKFPESSIGVFSPIEGGFNYVIASSDPELPKFSKSLNAKLNGRGGGRDGMVQGTYRVDKEAVEEAFDEIFSK